MAPLIKKPPSLVIKLIIFNLSSLFKINIGLPTLFIALSIIVPKVSSTLLVKVSFFSLSKVQNFSTIF